MAEQTLERELLDEFHRMPPDKQQQLVACARGLNTRPKGETGLACQTNRGGNRI